MKTQVVAGKLSFVNSSKGRSAYRITSYRSRSYLSQPKFPIYSHHHQSPYQSLKEEKDPLIAHPARVRKSKKKQRKSTERFSRPAEEPSPCPQTGVYIQ
jgi:hypothetical protein